METKLVYKGESLEIRRDTYEMSNKHIIKKDFVDHPGSVMIIGVREKKILFVKQWRQPIKKYTIELPCGTLHKSEISKIGADREFREETGFSAKNYSSIGKFYCAPGYSNEVKEIFIAGGLNPYNISDLNTKYRPWGVDVASGVEINNIKDISKIKAFVKNLNSK